MQSDIVQRLEALIERQRDARGDMLYKGSADPELVDARAEITRLTEALRRNMADHCRLIWKDEAQSVCPSTDDCFEYGDTVRCGPCAIKLAENAGVAPNMQLPNLPEVSRLRRENASLTEALRAAEEQVKELREAAHPFEFAVKHAPSIGARPHDFVTTGEFYALAAALKGPSHDA